MVNYLDCLESLGITVKITANQIENMQQAISVIVAETATGVFIFNSGTTAISVGCFMLGGLDSKKSWLMPLGEKSPAA
ncbi:hypothetical protein [Endozoicomonas acroporae]|uniref:hypothetical protein n=2 Tax=Endozoicomonas acroporae TaxID=1701104 RepID=UPI000C76C38B|nr:hypothetical protein [Endozoicomonas acroporae]